MAQPYAPNRLEHYTPDGPLLGSFRGASVAVGGNGNLFVAGADAFHRLLKLSPSGRVLATWPESPPSAQKAYGYTAVTVDPHVISPMRGERPRRMVAPRGETR